MQTLGEKHLIVKTAELMKQLRSQDSANGQPLRILDIGAEKSVVVEDVLTEQFGPTFECDRTDIVDCTVRHPQVKQCFIASVENMPQVSSNYYDLAFANYVLEHIEDLEKAVEEIARVLKPNGFFITSLPNPRAPEFMLAKLTPTSFHQFIKGQGEGRHAHEIHYAYKNINQLIDVFEKKFTTVEVRYFPNTYYGYLYRFPILNFLSRIYDGLVKTLNIKPLMGNVCLVFRKKI